MFSIGYDIGSSAVKAALLDVKSGKTVATATWPETEMAMNSPKPGWAEQNPSDWWENIRQASAKLKEKQPKAMAAVKAVGVTYQMHGLVLVDRDQKVLRPSIIWSDSRAVEVGEKAFRALGEEFCLSRFLNSPGNFTASKLRWVQENEPDIYKRIHKMMLPGDYVVMKLSGDIQTTITGLSEGILWNFKDSSVAGELLEHWGIDPDLIPEQKDSFSPQAEVSRQASEELGIPAGIPVTYRAGDQPNNAFSLNVLHPGEVAATAGTSGVVYGVMDHPSYDPASRVNTFVHVNHKADTPRYGVLLCVNGTGILNSWLRNTMFGGRGISYKEMDDQAGEIGPGADGVMVFPFGNGAERVLENRDPGAVIRGVSFNRHNERHLFRAGQEGIVYALAYGMEIMKNMGMEMNTIKAGRANMFLSPVFREVFINTTGAELKLYDTDGAQGAARGAAAGAGLYPSVEEAFSNLELLDHQKPDPKLTSAYAQSYGRWKEFLQQLIT
ncbi:FGGY family carbohydrate kinase [Balneolales bacterium ANBcel1]|nr:FGGY family carbohydrate kinase [Balneolales bacterium ANBcel1]